MTQMHEGLKNTKPLDLWLLILSEDLGNHIHDSVPVTVQNFWIWIYPYETTQHDFKKLQIQYLWNFLHLVSGNFAKPTLKKGTNTAMHIIKYSLHVGWPNLAT